MRLRNNVFIDNPEQVLSFLETRSLSLYEYVRNSDSAFHIHYKYLLHADLTNRGKRNGSQERLDKNLLYYLTVDEMEKIEENSGKPFESTKQSNIGMPIEFFEDIDMPRLQRRSGYQETQHKHMLLNDYCKGGVFLVNDTVGYFTFSYTQKVFSKLGKTEPKNWDTDNLKLDTGAFTAMTLTHAIHGLGVEQDVLFHKLRLSMFKNDTFIIVIEKAKNGTQTLFVLLEKNPRFFTIIGESNAVWEHYLETRRSQEISATEAQKRIEKEEKNRNSQDKWKKLLAAEMMNYTTHDGEVFCPFTQISADFETVPMLFIASHIKSFADSEVAEAFDVNNGLLLCANADALFDKHMITVGEDKKLIFSFLIDNNAVLKHRLLLNQPIFDIILNDIRMKYMKEHRETFCKKEAFRKTK
ncbi:MAG: HNH endonuclease [Clostridiales bacterium]|jgi:hypothetical protein|nr:HNH endonuclease [Clostridiales bacterium]